MGLVGTACTRPGNSTIGIFEIYSSDSWHSFPAISV